VSVVVFRKACRDETSSTEAVGLEIFCAGSVEAKARAVVSAKIFVVIRTREFYARKSIVSAPFVSL
jgi:hypothetical protein